MPDLVDRLRAALADRYLIEHELGRGGMAIVYLAEDRKHQRRVALKVLRPELAALVTGERFLREITTAARLAHPNILPLFDSGEADGTLYYTMPYIEGESLRDRLNREKQLPIDDALQITQEVAEALGYAHEQGIIHRDIKPENILFQGGHALVADFGIARAVSAAGVETLTETGLAVGTPAYMSPEQGAGSSELDARSDLYSLGCVLYEMLSGETPYTATTAQALIAKKLSEAIPHISVVRETVPAAVEAALMKALAKNPVDRFATAAEFSQALTGETVTATSLPPRRRLGPRAAILAVLGLGLVAAGAYGARWFLQTGGPGTVFASGIVDPGDRVLLADFVNRTDDSTLGYAVHEGLRALLSDTRLVRLVDQYSVQAALERMGLSPYTRLDEHVAREVAERDNAKVFITGEITQIGTGYQIVARIVGTADGAELRVERATAQSDDEFFDAMDDLGESLRRGIGESVRSALGRPPLPQVTTASLPALRTFATAARLELGGEGNERAISLLEDAVALDTTFAEAYRWLAAINDNLGHAAEAVRAIDQAYRWRERLPAIERLWIEGDFHALHGDIIAAVDAYQRVLDLDSANGVALVHLSDKRLQQRDYAGAESLALRFLSLGYRWSVGYWNAVEALVSQQRFAAAESVLAPMAPSGVRAQLGITLLLARRDWSAASEYYARDSLARRECPWCSPLMALVQGRHAEADRLWKAGSNWSTGLSLWWQLYQTRYRSADTARISRELDALLVRVNWDSLPPERRETWLLVQALAEVGHVAEARQRFAEWRALGPTDPRLPEYVDYCEGVIALAEGRLDSAAAAFIRWHAAPFSSATHTFNRGLVEAGDAFDRLGQADSAVVLYERALTLPTVGGLSYETLWYPFVLRRLGELHASLGHREQAIDYYGQFIALWKDADPQLQPQVEEARAALARLTAEPRRQ